MLAFASAFDFFVGSTMGQGSSSLRLLSSSPILELPTASLRAIEQAKEVSLYYERTSHTMGRMSLVTFMVANLEAM